MTMKPTRRFEKDAEISVWKQSFLMRRYQI
jgi:hypothetical protein